MSNLRPITILQLYPNDMNIYGDWGNVLVLKRRLEWHGYAPQLVEYNVGDEFPENVDVIIGGGGQDSGQARVEQDLERNGPLLKSLAEDGTPMLMICGMYQLFGNDFLTVDGQRLPGLGILDVTTRGNKERMIGPVVLDTPHGQVVGYENHSGATTLGDGQEPFGTVRHGRGNNGKDGSEGARRHHVYGTYLHGPVLPANAQFADALIKAAVDRAFSRGFEPEDLDDTLADEAQQRQITRLLTGRNKPH